MREMKPEELVFTIKKKKRKKQEGDNKHSRQKLRSRELKVCRFSVQAFQEEMQTPPQTRDRTIT